MNQLPAQEKTHNSVDADVIMDKDVPASKEGKVVLQARRLHQGPLPAPESLAQYENICPGAADRIISMAESELKAINKMRIKEYRAQRLGVILGFFAVIMVIALTGFAIYMDKQWVASAIAAIVSTCSVIISRNNKHEENNT